MHTCIPSQRLKRSWHSCPSWVNAGNKNTPACTIHEDRMILKLPLWLEYESKTVTFPKISPLMVNPRDIAGNTEEEEDKRNQALWPLASCIALWLGMKDKVLNVATMLKMSKQTTIPSFKMFHKCPKEEFCYNMKVMIITLRCTLFNCLWVMPHVKVYNNNNNNNSNNNFIERHIQDFLQSPHCAVNCLQHVSSRSPRWPSG